HQPKRVAVEVNRDVVPAARHAEHRLGAGDSVEIVTLVGGGSGEPADKPLVLGRFRFASRLFTGTGKFATYDLMRDSLAASG
ncbi:sulfur carrier protein ThiS, partial [Klebsiella pneumoniae]|nr:sulfur carrier protein ThiS [Klebsiella pneumoniae]